MNTSLSKLHKIYFDIDCETSLFNRKFLIEKISNYQRHVKQKTEIIKVRDIDNFAFVNRKYIFLVFQVFDISTDNKLIIVNFTRYVYIINNLKVKMFINNDFFNSKIIIINLKKQKITIKSCQNITTFFNVINKDISIKRIIKVNNITTILTNFVIIIFFKLRDKFDLFDKKFFMFILQRIERLNIESNIMLYIVNAYIVVV